MTETELETEIGDRWDEMPMYLGIAIRYLREASAGIPTMDYPWLRAHDLSDYLFDVAVALRSYAKEKNPDRYRTPVYEGKPRLATSAPVTTAG